MKISHHSLHQPRCGVCFKHCKSFESVREHLNVPDHLFKGDCKSIFSERGCTLCLQIFEDATALADHKNKCHLSPPLPLLLALTSQGSQQDRPDGLRCVEMHQYGHMAQRQACHSLEVWKLTKGLRRIEEDKGNKLDTVYNSWAMQYKGVGRVDGELGKATSQLDQLVYEFIQLV
ncbi:hypothetical protein F2Q70_00024223 [Brassica cretica]|uniref:C2H2-type domain-containing protein n=1 Tax=Brassica cretica TaxID=69181 RepID=A0A8S9L3X5_BRACR|nr:hypothetical protein F2Q70_00024223 [Brassica cretica]